MAQLLDERDLGVLTSCMSLLVALVSNNHEAYWSCVPKCVKTLERLARNQDIPQEYTYYGIPSPWLQVSIHTHTHMYVCFFFFLSCLSLLEKEKMRSLEKLITSDLVYTIFLLSSKS